MELRAVEGKLSEHYNHFMEYRFEACEATDTRLMGVLAMRISWRSIDNPQAMFYQIIHLDYSEYGVDDYFEFDCSPDSDSYQDMLDSMNYHWYSFTSVMGGKLVQLPVAEMLALIDEAIPIARYDGPREYDDEENVEFRRNALIRLELMKEALKASNKYSHDAAIGSDTRAADNCNSCHTDKSYNEIMSLVVPASLSTCETINYFLMRMVDCDFKAAAYLSTIGIETLSESPLADMGIQSLIRNSIKKSTDKEASEGRHPYNCRMMTLAASGYYFASFVIYLDGDYTKKNSKVVDIQIGTIDKLSEVEAALQHSQQEYITVFDCRDRILNHFDGDKISVLEGVNPQQVPNGWLYTIYNKDNSHVNSAEYRISDDVYGYAHLSIDGEFILMSNKLYNINRMDESTMLSIYRPFMTLTGRYRMETPVFHTLINSYGVMFRQLIDQPEYSK